MDGLRNEEDELMGILTRRRHSHGPLPVVVEMRQHEGQHLVAIRGEGRVVVQGVVADRHDRALVDELRHEVEVVPEEDCLQDSQDSPLTESRTVPGSGLASVLPIFLSTRILTFFVTTVKVIFVLFFTPSLVETFLQASCT